MFSRICLFQFLLMCILLLKANSAEEERFDTYYRKEHSIVKPYQIRGMEIPNWDYTGGTLVTNEFIRLTPDRQTKTGGLWSRIPVLYQNWELHIQFHVHGSGKNLFGDGFAFWYTETRDEQGPIFGSKDNFSGLTVVFDTFQNDLYSNQDFPYISAAINNGSASYDFRQDGKGSMIGGCPCKFRQRTPTLVSISYIKRQLTVNVNLENKDEWKLCFYTPEVMLPTGYFFGFSSATGDLADNHDIISVRAYEVDAKQEINPQDTPSENIVPSVIRLEGTPKFKIDSFSPRTYKVFIFLALFFLMVTLVGLAALFWYKQSHKHKQRLF